MAPTAFTNYHATPEHAGLALVAVLRKLFPGDSWSEARRLIEHRHVEINGNLCVDEGRKIQPGDVLKVWKEPRQAPPKADDVKILYQDLHILVVEKPVGMTTTRHAEEQTWPVRRRQFQPTLDEHLARILTRKQAAKRGGRPGPLRVPRVRAVHRLDRDTSGVMVFALSAEAERRLIQMFRKHDVVRVYQAIVHGRVKEQTIESNLVRDRGDRRRGSTTLPETGKRAVTHVRPLEQLDGYTLIECRLETGRTHQIRIHLAESGHVVCGEKVYNKPLFGDARKDRSGAHRQMLHAGELRFRHPITDEPLKFSMPMPKDMARLLILMRAKP